MSRVALGACLALTAFLAAQLGVAVVVAFASRVPRRPRAAADRARLVLALRLAPAASAVLVALLTALAFVYHEPPDTGERLAPPLLAAGLLGAGLVLSGGWRAVRAALVTRRLTRTWRAGARPLVLPRAPVPAYRIEHAFPVVAVVGAFRPRLFLASSVLDRLSPTELGAVVAHEAGHVARRDNLKRWLALCCPDLPLLGRVARRLDREWEDAAECAADEQAAGGSPRAARHLASALVKVARLMPAGARLSVSAVPLLSEGTVRGRVERLLSMTHGTSLRTRPAGPVALLVAAALLGLAAAALPRTLVVLHGVLEAVVQSLG